MHLALNPVPFLGNPFALRLLRALPAAVRRAVLVSDASRNVHELAKNSTVAIFQPQGSVVECLEGCVWITLDGDVRDVVIAGGQSFRPDRSRRTLIHALESSRVRVAQAG